MLIHIHTHSHIHSHIHIHTHTFSHIHINTHIHTHKIVRSMSACKYMHSHCPQVCLPASGYLHAPMLANDACLYPCACTYLHVHVFTYICVRLSSDLQGDWLSQDPVLRVGP